MHSRVSRCKRQDSASELRALCPEIETSPSSRVRSSDRNHLIHILFLRLPAPHYQFNYNLNMAAKAALSGPLSSRTVAFHLHPLVSPRHLDVVPQLKPCSLSCAPVLDVSPPSTPTDAVQCEFCSNDFLLSFFFVFFCFFDAQDENTIQYKTKNHCTKKPVTLFFDHLDMKTHRKMTRR